MKVLVCGGRDFSDRDRLWSVLDRLHHETPISTLIHGACGASKELPQPPYHGADGLADSWALATGVPVDRNPADWNGVGRKAGPTRNRRMLEKEPDVVVAFSGGAGTAHMVSIARARGLRVEVIG